MKEEQNKKYKKDRGFKYFHEQADSYFHVAKSFGHDLIPIDVGIEYSAKDKLIIKDTYPFYLMQYVFKGEGSVIINKKKYLIKSGTMFIIPPNVPVEHFQNSKHPWAFYWINFNGMICKKLIAQTDFNKNIAIIPPQKKQLIKLFQRALHAKNKPLTQAITIISVIYSIFELLINTNKPDENNNKSETLNFLDVLEYIDQNIFNSELSEHFITEHFFVSTSYLSHKFSTHVSTTFSQYINNQRIKKATELLTCSDYPVSTISNLVGYKSPFYFSRIFKKLRLVCPDEYRKECNPKYNQFSKIIK